MSERVPVLAVRAMLRGFEHLGLDVSRVFRTGTVTPSELQDPFTSVRGDIAEKLWMRAFDKMPDVTLPTQVGFGIPPYELDLLDHVTGTADTVGDALRIINRYRGMMSNEMSLYFERGSDDWIWIRTRMPGPYRAVTEQWALAVLYGRQRQTPGFTIEEVHLTHTDHGNAEDFARYWEAPVKLGRRRTGMRLSAGVWNTPNPYADPDLRAMLTRFAEDIRERIVDRLSIRERMNESFSRGRYTTGAVAMDLKMSTRSLQRRLTDETLSFTAILDDYRRERTFELLREGEREAGAIAHSIGYQNQSSFNRSFRRWTGSTPTEWMRLRSGAAGRSCFARDEGHPDASL